MPSIVTHHIFAKEVKKQLPKNIQSKINNDIFYIFAQSFDNLFYYKFPSFVLQGDKKYR